MLFVLHGRLRILYYFGAKLGEQSQTEVPAMMPNALVRILRAAGFELCAVGPASHCSTFTKGIRMLSSKLCRSLLWPYNSNANQLCRNENLT